MNCSMVWMVFLALFCSSVQAVVCRPLFDRESAPSTYYALVFLDSASIEESDRLMSQVTPTLSDIPRKVSEQSGSSTRLKVELVVCIHRVGGGDFTLEEMKRYLSYKVVAVFWKNQEGNDPGLVQLAVPVYMRIDSPLRRDVEVVTHYTGTSADPVDSWMEVFGQAGAFYKPFVAMGLATAYVGESDFRQAWRALCDSRVGLAMLPRNPLRPNREVLDRDIAGQLLKFMGEVEGKARSAGIRELPACMVPKP